MPSINDPRKGYNAQTGKVEEFSPRRRPETSNADEWALWLQEHADYGVEFKAVQIAEALDSMHRGGFNAGAKVARAMLAALEEHLAASDALTAFLLAADPKVMGEQEWRVGHAQRSLRRNNSITAARAAIAAAKAAGL